jgi:hypothetical protein
VTSLSVRNYDFSICERHFDSGPDHWLTAMKGSSQRMC